jgi:hypothetical protein
MDTSMSKTLVLILAAVVLFTFAAPLLASPIILSEVINVPGQDGWQPPGGPSSSSGPLVVYLPAGNYTATPVEPPFPGAEYTAYSFFAYGGAWAAEFNVGTPSDPRGLISQGSNGLTDTSFASPSDAFQIALAWGGGLFSLATPQDVAFSVGDSYYPDNTGGVSIDLVGTPLTSGPPGAITPEPGNLVLLGTGLAGLAGLTRMKQLKKQVA